MSDSTARLERRTFLALMAAGLGTSVHSVAAQTIDPTTGQQVHGQSAPDQAPDTGTYQFDPDADVRHNISSFRSHDWRPYFEHLEHGAILMDIASRAMHFWSEDETIYRLYPSSVPISEELTRRGRTQVVQKVEHPTWTPTPSMRERDPSLPKQVAGGDPRNPLGPYALYLSWQYFRIHGTHDTRKIARKSSDGCFGLYNEHIKELYHLAEVGTQVLVI